MGDHLGIPGARGFLPTRRGPLAPAARPDSWIPPAAPAPPGPRGAGGRGPDSRCRPGLPPRGPRARDEFLRKLKVYSNTKPVLKEILKSLL